jgi:exodeoxyribonuclease VII small subunit
MEKFEGRKMAKNNKQKNDSSEMSFEEALAMLTDIVSKIEKGEVPLQDSIEQYERGMSLIKHCREILQKAEKRIEKITESEDK